MSDYMRSQPVAEEDYDDYDDASDLDGFVASDDDDELLDEGGLRGQDYSAEIRKLFKYDPRRSVR